MEITPLKIVDLELEDDVMKGIKVIDPYPKAKKLDHGLPEHQWCPPKKEDPKMSPKEQESKVISLKFMKICLFPQI